MYLMQPQLQPVVPQMSQQCLQSQPQWQMQLPQLQPQFLLHPHFQLATQDQVQPQTRTYGPMPLLMQTQSHPLSENQATVETPIANPHRKAYSQRNQRREQIYQPQSVGIVKDAKNAENKGTSDAEGRSFQENHRNRKRNKATNEIKRLKNRSKCYFSNFLSRAL